MGYTKLFEELIASSVWDEDDKTRLVWITMLALKDRKHFVRATERYLALAARVSLDECQRALLRLSSPDPQSHRKEKDGRRIEAVDGGWNIINGEYYSQKLNIQARRAYKAEKQQEYRDRKNRNSPQARERQATQINYNDPPPQGTDHFQEQPV
jgi:hypothetical protein